MSESKSLAQTHKYIMNSNKYYITIHVHKRKTHKHEQITYNHMLQIHKHISRYTRDYTRSGHNGVVWGGVGMMTFLAHEHIFDATENWGGVGWWCSLHMNTSLMLRRWCRSLSKYKRIQVLAAAALHRLLTICYKYINIYLDIHTNMNSHIYTNMDIVSKAISRCTRHLMTSI